MSKFKKNQIYLQGFVYLSCATCTAVWQNGGFSGKLKFSFQKKFSSKLKVSSSKSATSPSCETSDCEKTSQSLHQI
jgi:hypothetical protein